MDSRTAGHSSTPTNPITSNTAYLCTFVKEIRITAILVETTLYFHRQDEKYDGKVADIFVQSDSYNSETARIDVGFPASNLSSIASAGAAQCCGDGVLRCRHGGYPQFTSG
jgi:hypothetical protein